MTSNDGKFDSVTFTYANFCTDKTTDFKFKWESGWSFNVYDPSL